MNLGAIIAHAIADPVGKPAFIVDPVVVDELEARADAEAEHLRDVVEISATEAQLTSVFVVGQRRGEKDPLHARTRRRSARQPLSRSRVYWTEIARA